MKYIHDQNVWGAWVGGCWNVQSSTKDTIVKSRLNKLNEELWESIAGMANPLRQQMIQFAKKCETNKNMDAVISIAKMVNWQLRARVWKIHSKILPFIPHWR